MCWCLIFNVFLIFFPSLNPSFDVKCPREERRKERIRKTCSSPPLSSTWLTSSNASTPPWTIWTTSSPPGTSSGKTGAPWRRWGWRRGSGGWMDPRGWWGRWTSAQWLGRGQKKDRKWMSWPPHSDLVEDGKGDRKAMCQYLRTVTWKRTEEVHLSGPPHSDLVEDGEGDRKWMSGLPHSGQVENRNGDMASIIHCVSAITSPVAIVIGHVCLSASAMTNNSSYKFALFKDTVLSDLVEYKRGDRKSIYHCVLCLCYMHSIVLWLISA